MRRTTVVLAIVGVGISCLTVQAATPPATRALSDASAVVQRVKLKDDQSGPQASGMVLQDVLIAHSELRVVFFGLFETTAMTGPGWDLYEGSVSWANDFRDPATTKVFLVLATFDGTLNPQDPREANGKAVFDRLIGNMGFMENNINVDDRHSIPQANFQGFDIVLYAHTEGVDATNVIDQGKPFVTMSPGQTDELSIGTGERTNVLIRDLVHVYNNSHPITKGYAVGEVRLDRPMRMFATESIDRGVELVTLDDISFTCADIKKSRAKCKGRRGQKRKIITKDIARAPEVATICKIILGPFYPRFKGKRIKLNVPAEPGKVYQISMEWPDCPQFDKEVRCR